MSKLLLGDTRPNEIWLNEQNEIKQIYMGQDLIWERVPDIWTLYYNGTINGITWQKNAYGEAATALTPSTYLQLYSSSVVRGSWRTSTPIRVPRTAHTLQVRLAKYNTTPRANFGLIHKSVTGDLGHTNVSNGGQIYGWFNGFGGNNAISTLNMTLNDNLKNSTDYYFVVTALFPGSSRSDLRFYGARFLDANGNYLN